jgi:Leucine-rich repeat (LRR) protein
MLKVTFKNLYSLDIRGNELVEIEEAMCLNLAQLTRLDIRNNRLKVISPHIKAMMSLKSLRLDANLLEEIPPEIGELYFLEELTFSENRIKELPSALFNKLGESLRLLNFSDNKIKHIPAEIGTLSAL